ncbi:hypothetical protein [Siminovitchia fordii]|uniref:Uncharacterized protein n=1 Tax=Siminovitchia fordii TaxID=254759 RepID=A0ABQ4KBL1_9BACI|nr:hypothetical protein [Siminovitchia fordii]GIN23137.1 hypothetical protein J1TS3_42710 [Siminovitchia fordii]
MIRLGSGYLGSPSLMNSGEGSFQVIPNPPENWSMKYNFYKFEFACPNIQEVTVKINEGEPICLGNGYFATEYYDAPIWSFVVVDPDVDFYWYGAY